jgi:peptidoglycan/xylan/chitin deacetylase (PgdA/CDA1 family)
MPRRPAVSAAAIALAALSLCAAGCHHKQAEIAVTSAAPPKPKPTISEIDLKSYHPNEAGAVMILMYHRINPKEPNNDLNRQPDSFRKDLEDLYSRGYRPVTVGEFVDNKMDVPIGKTPVVLTFDDSLPTQFNIVRGADGQPHIDPNCAVGIMETFHKAHPDWPTRATFFVLPEYRTDKRSSPVPFYDPNTVADKFDYLLKSGYEIANHTTTHPQMNRLSADKIQWEIGNAKHSIEQISPKIKLDVVALPYGRLPRKEDRKFLLDGTGGGATYHNKAVILAAYRPVYSPVNYVGKKTAVYQIAPYNPMGLERIKPNPSQANLPGTFEYWLKWFDENPSQRYVSDGNMNLVSVPKSLVKMVDANAVKKQGKELFAYSMGGAGGGGLSVEANAAGATGSTGSTGGGLSVEPASGGGSSVGAKGAPLGVESSSKR